MFFLLSRRLTVPLFIATIAAVPAWAARLPAPIRDVLDRTGVMPRDVQDLVTDALAGHEPGISETPDPNMAARMDRARHDDVVVHERDSLFDDANVRLGLWGSPVFMRNYGTALLLTAPYDNRRTPVFLVHGINGSPRDFAALVSQFRASSYQPIVFYYPTGMPLADASRELGARMHEFLDRHPTNAFAVVGHSMGGLVAKGALDRSNGGRDFPAWKALVGISSPWSGVAPAAQAHRLPVHPASWDDLAPTSTYVRRINMTPIPRRIGFYVLYGVRGNNSLASVLGNNDGRLSVTSMSDTGLGATARGSFAFEEDHTSILRASGVLARLQIVLDRETGSDRQPRS